MELVKDSRMTIKMPHDLYERADQVTEGLAT